MKLELKNGYTITAYYQGLVTSPWFDQKEESKKVASATRKMLNKFMIHLIDKHIEGWAKGECSLFTTVTIGRHEEIVDVRQKKVISDYSWNKPWKEHPYLALVTGKFTGSDGKIRSLPYGIEPLVRLDELKYLEENAVKHMIGEDVSGKYPLNLLFQRLERCMKSWESVEPLKSAPKVPHYKIHINEHNENWQFDFYSSINDAEKRVTSLDDYNLGNAFLSFLRDCQCWHEGEDNFYEEFGYEKPSILTWRRIKESSELYDSFLAACGDIYDLQNELEDYQ